MPRSKDIIKLKFRRTFENAEVTLWVAPEFEALMKRLSCEAKGKEESIKESEKWKMADGSAMRFYINAKDELEQELLRDCENVFNNYGGLLINRRRAHILEANIALLRTVGASVGKGVIFAATEDITIEDLKFYCETVAQWATKLYEKHMRTTKFEATISYII